MTELISKELKKFEYQRSKVEKGYTNWTLGVDISTGKITIKPVSDKMKDAQALARLAFTNAGVGNVHAMAHQLGAVYDMAHGLANAVILPFVMEYNLIASPVKFAEAALVMRGGNWNSLSASTLGVRSRAMVVALNRDLNIPSRLKDCGVAKGDLDMLINKSMEDAAVTTNPRDTTLDSMAELWNRAFHGKLQEETEAALGDVLYG